MDSENRPEDRSKTPSILVVEDDEGLRSNFKFLLEHEGYLVQEAPHGKAALELLRQSLQTDRPPPSLILLDLEMPVMNGWELITFLKTNRDDAGQWGKIPLIVCSGATHREPDILKHAAFVFPKPTDLTPLLEAIRSLLK